MSRLQDTTGYAGCATGLATGSTCGCIVYTRLNFAIVPSHWPECRRP